MKAYKPCKGQNKAKGHPGCGKEVPAKNRKYGLCQNCFKDWVKNTSEGFEWYRGNKISLKSNKRKADDKVYSKLREEFLKVNTICRVTGFKATEIHHTFSGKDRNKYYLITSTWMAVSREGHNWIHNNPKKARLKGWLK